MSKYLIIVFAFLSFNTFAQESDLVKYLNAYKTSEFEESQTIISDYSFGQGAKYTMAAYSKFEGMSFNTDIPTIKGYKAIGICKLKNEAGGFIDKRMMVVMYFDKTKNHWSVFSLREPAESNTEYETSKSSVEANNFYTSKEIVYRHLAYWSIMAGQLQDGKKYIELAIEASKDKKKKNSIPFDTANIDFSLKCIM